MINFADDEPGGRDVTAAYFMNGAGLGAVRAEGLAMMPAQMHSQAPMAVLVADLWEYCGCGKPDCPGWSGRAAVAITVGHEGFAAMVGSYRAWIEMQSVDVRDRAEAIERDQLAAGRQSLRGDT